MHLKIPLRKPQPVEDGLKPVAGRAASANQSRDGFGEDWSTQNFS